MLTPLVFAQRVFDPVTGEFDAATTGRAVAATAIFCLLSGAVYLLNDLADLDKDRQHPTKRHRPLASGRLPVGIARRALIALLAVSLGAAWVMAPAFCGAALAYFGINVLYSFRIKHVPYLDVLSIAAGFLLRVLGGALSIAVPGTAWLYATTFFLALFLALGKRRHELLSAAESAEKQRKVLGKYRLASVTAAMRGAALVTAGIYAAYTFSPHAATQFGAADFSSPSLPWTLPFIGFGLWRFDTLVARSDDPVSPTEAMIRDRAFVANLGLWAAAIAAIIYL